MFTFVKTRMNKMNGSTMSVAVLCPRRQGPLSPVAVHNALFLEQLWPFQPFALAMDLSAEAYDSQLVDEILTSHRDWFGRRHRRDCERRPSRDLGSRVRPWTRRRNLRALMAQDLVDNVHRRRSIRHRPSSSGHNHLRSALSHISVILTD